MNENVLLGEVVLVPGQAGLHQPGGEAAGAGHRGGGRRGAQQQAGRGVDRRGEPRLRKIIILHII